MSLRFLSTQIANRRKIGAGIAAMLALMLGLGLFSAADAAPGSADPRLNPVVQNYAEQAVPAPGVPPAQPYYDSPLAAGTLTLEDVLEAHKPNPETANLPAIGASPTSTATAPLLTPPTQSSSTSLMMSQGMRAVLQKVGETSSAAPPSQMRAPSPGGVPIQAQGQPTALVPDTSANATGVKYEPGQEPKNLAAAAGAAPAAAASAGNGPTVSGSGVPLSGPDVTAASVASSIISGASAAAAAPTASSASSTQTCDKDVQKWEKTCAEAGYPATYVGKIVGETHTGCGDGALHDIWVTNSCAPPDAGNSQTATTDAVCGPASNNQYDEAPTSNLCSQGIASAVSGSGPWTWACSGVNGGQAAACTAHQRVATITGACGAANGVAVTSAPSSNLCDAGDSTPVKGSGPWTWSCRGAGTGSSQSCIAPVMTVLPPSATPAETVSEENPAPSSSAAAIPETASSADTSDKGELCGTAAETLAYQMPERDLCRAGSASVVNGDGPWTWSCTDNEGRSSSCRTLSLGGESAPEPAAAAVPARSVPEMAAAPAPAAPSSELACGLAAAQPMPQAPSDELCLNGKAGAVRGSGPWRWTCTGKGHRKISCETPMASDGACGAANGASLRSAPFAGLCSSGTPTGIEGDGPWTWTCNGSGGGVNVSCGASLQNGPAARGKVEGSCGDSANKTLASAPTGGLCNSGMPSAVSGEGPWTWSCSGSNGGAVSSCAASKYMATQAPGPMVNGLCGAANGVMAASQPVDGLCSTGSMTGIVGNGPWNWSCLGENGGMTVSCTAPLQPPEPINGACGAANGISTLVKPQSALCSSGLTGSVSGSGPWTWTCSGANGGAPASCVAPVAGRTGEMPSINTPGPSGYDSALAPAPSSGLVTPRLAGSGDTQLPALDKKVIPRLTPSAPQAVTLAGEDAPDAAASLPGDMQPVTPPAISGSLSPAATLRESVAETESRIPGNHLTLDPTISTVLFTHGSGNIDEPVLSGLDRLSGVLQNNPDTRITLTAYADNAGSTPRDARRLSLTRALAVRDYLESKGIAESRIDVRAEGANTNVGYMDRVDVRVND